VRRTEALQVYKSFSSAASIRVQLKLLLWLRLH